jgi:DNA-binding transcriptional MerR regulator
MPQTEVALALVSLLVVESLFTVTYTHQTFSDAFKKADQAWTRFYSRADNLEQAHRARWLLDLGLRLHRRRSWLALVRTLCGWVAILGLTVAALEGLWLWLTTQFPGAVIIEDLFRYTTYTLFGLALVLLILLCLAIAERGRARTPEAVLSEAEELTPKADPSQQEKSDARNE